MRPLCCNMERPSRVIVCPKCRETVKVRDVSHFRGHGIRISRWKCPDCSKEVASDRSTDLRDHVRRRHKDSDPDTIIPVWGNLEENGQGLRGTTRPSWADSRRVESAAGRPPSNPSTTPKSMPASGTPATATPGDTSLGESPVIDLIIGDVSFLTSTTPSTSSSTPTKLPKSVVRRAKMLSPVKGASGPRAGDSKSPTAGKRQRSTSISPSTPDKSRRSRASRASSFTQDDVVTFLSALPRREWEEIQRRVQAERHKSGETSPSKAVQTRNLQRASVQTISPATEESEVQTARQVPSVMTTQGGFVIAFPCGSTLDVHGPAWTAPAPPPADEDDEE